MLESSFAESSDNLTLSIAVSPKQTIINTSYQIQAINELVDFVNVLAYDVRNNY
jgi:GH18 family chitinase